MSYDYKEKADDLSPSMAGFGVEGGRASLPLFVTDEELDGTIIDLLGDVAPDGTGGLARKLPKAHPRFPWMYAVRISNIQGVGFAGRESSDPNGELEAPPLERYALYKKYLLTVEFEPRPYAVLKDASIGSDEIVNYDEEGLPTPYTAKREWERFTDLDKLPRPELVSAQHGQMSFRTESAAKPHKVPFSGFPKMTVPTNEIKFRWFQVPFSYLDSDNSYLSRYVGFINQADWNGYPAGSLLYLGCTARRYTPAVPSFEAGDEEEGGGAAPSAYERVCDIEMTFLHTTREGTDTPSPATLANANWIPAGHNLQPWLKTREFYYCANVSKADPNNELPTYLSVDFALLFRDPDAP